MRVVKLSQNHTELVERFCEACQVAGYGNNSTLAAMKWGGTYDLPSPAQWWALIDDDQILSISGCHGIGDHQLRTLFRSATLPQYQKLIPGLSKTHMNSVPFSILLPHQIRWGLDNGYREFYITTSHGEHDASGKMWRTHRAMSLLSKTGIVEHYGEEVVYHTPQTIWRINVERYWSARRAADDTIRKIITD